MPCSLRWWLRRLTESPVDRVKQELALPSADRFSASVNISVCVCKSTFQLSDAIDKEAHVIR